MTRQMAVAAVVLLATGATSCAARTQSGTPGGVPSGVPPVYAAMPARPEGPLKPRPAAYKVDAIDLTLIPGQAVEYKFRLDQGAVMIYSWKVVEGTNVRFDFHTVPDGKPISASERFMAAETSQANGHYVAPYAGLHGWWWENSGKDIATIRINASGFFTGAVMFAPEPTEMEVQDPPPPPEF